MANHAAIEALRDRLRNGYDMRLAAREARAAGAPVAKIAAEIGRTPQTVYQWLRMDLADILAPPKRRVRRKKTARKRAKPKRAAKITASQRSDMIVAGMMQAIADGMDRDAAIKNAVQFGAQQTAIAGALNLSTSRVYYILLGRPRTREEQGKPPPKSTRAPKPAGAKVRGVQLDERGKEAALRLGNGSITHGVRTAIDMIDLTALSHQTQRGWIGGDPIANMLQRIEQGMPRNVAVIRALNEGAKRKDVASALSLSGATIYLIHSGKTRSPVPHRLGGKKYKVEITDQQVAKAEMFGEGNMSEGIRRALELATAKTKSPDA